MNRKGQLQIIVGIIILAVVVGGFWYFNNSGSGVTSDTIKGIPSEKIKEFDMIAKQWLFSPNEIEVNRGDTVILNVRSIDVNHGLAIPRLGINEFLSPGNTVKIEFVAHQSGTFDFACNISCGVGHGGMRGRIIVR